MLADNKALVRRLFEEVWNQGNLTAIDELFATSYIRYDPAAPEAKGLAGFKHFVTTLRRAFPDIEVALEDVIADQGEYLGIAPTGRQVAVMGTVTLRIVHDKFQEGWLNMDTLGLLQQLGAIPPLGQIP